MLSRALQGLERRKPGPDEQRQLLMQRNAGNDVRVHVVAPEQQPDAGIVQPFRQRQPEVEQPGDGVRGRSLAAAISLHYSTL